MMRSALLAALLLLTCGVAPASAGAAAALVEKGLAAEARMDAARALECFLAAEAAGAADAFLLQKIARQYSDLMVDQPTRPEKRAYAEKALEYSLRAVAAEPDDAVNVLSVAISYGKLGLTSDTGEKVRHARQVREYAERALKLDPEYAWAHHILGRWHHEVAALSGAAKTFVRWFYGGLRAASTADAVRHLERAVELEPGELQHHLELGFAYLATGDAARARASFERGLAMPSRAQHDDPAKTRARNALGRL